MTCKTAHQMWTRLKAQYELASEENKHLLIQRFMGYEFERGYDVLNHITTIENLASQLNEIGQTIPESHVITKILMTLPPNYHPFISVWNNMDEEKKTVEKLTRKLQQEEAPQLATKEFTQDNSDSAFFAKRNSRFKIQRGGNPTGQRNNRTDRQKPVSGFNRNLRLQCAFCRKDNSKSTHKEEDCWRKEAYMQGRRDAEKEMGMLAIGETTHQSSRDQDYAFQSTPENRHSTDDDA